MFTFVREINEVQINVILNIKEKNEIQIYKII